MGGTLLLVNHVQNAYLDPNNPDDVELQQKIFDFVDGLRPNVDNIAWSYAMETRHEGLPFNVESERPKSYKAGDIVLTNNDGNGLDSGFLQTIFDIDPDHVILVGVYFEACSAATAMTIKDSISTSISVPMDMTNPPDELFADYYNSKRQELHDKGIDVTSPSSRLFSQACRDNIGLKLVSSNEQPLNLNSNDAL